jgi:hypothetical protein
MLCSLDRRTMNKQLVTHPSEQVDSQVDSLYSDVLRIQFNLLLIWHLIIMNRGKRRIESSTCTAD